MVYQSVFSKLTLPSTRFYTCDCQTHALKASFSPLAEQLPKRSSPELRYLQTKYAALMSYGLSLDLLDDVLPIKGAVSLTGLKGCVREVAGQLTPDHQALTEEASRRRYLDQRQVLIPELSPVRAVGIDGSFVRHCQSNGRQDSWFEVIVGKSLRDDQPVTFLSDGGESVRQTYAALRLPGEAVLNWWHLAARFQNLTQIAKGMTDRDERGERLTDALIEKLNSAKWHLWHGCPYRSRQRLDSLSWEIKAIEAPTSQAKQFKAKLYGLMTYVENNRDCIVNYGDRYRHGEPITTSFVESAVNQIVSKRFVKKQQMRWSPAGAQALLQVRTTVLNNELQALFHDDGAFGRHGG